MLAQIVALVLGTAADLLCLVFVARVMMQWVRAPFRNPVGEFVAATTNWAILPLRRIIPGLFGADLASLFAAWLVQIAYFGIMTGLAGLAVVSLGSTFAVAWLAALAVLRMIVHVMMGAIIIAALLSWINPYAPFAQVFQALSRPLLAPIQRRLPLLGGIDLSPLVALVLLQVVLILLGGLAPRAPMMLG